MKCNSLPCEHWTWRNRYSGPHLRSVLTSLEAMSSLSLHHLQGKLMSFGIFWVQAPFDYSKKEHKGLVP